MSKRKRKVRFDPLDKIDLPPPELPEQHPLAHLHAGNRAIETTEVDGYTGLEAYNYLVQNPHRTRAAKNCFGPCDLEDELGFRGIVLFMGSDGKVMGQLDEYQREQLAQIVPPITEAELISIIEEKHSEFLRKREADND